MALNPCKHKNVKPLPGNDWCKDCGAIRRYIEHVWPKEDDISRWRTPKDLIAELNAKANEKDFHASWDSLCAKCTKDSVFCGYRATPDKRLGATCDGYHDIERKRP